MSSNHQPPMPGPVHGSKAPFLLHVGLHKTASTWLQQEVFAKQRHWFDPAWGALSAEAVRHFINVDPLKFHPAAAAAFFAPGRRRAREQGLIPVLSHEALSSRPYAGHYYAPVVAERLKEVFPDARVVIGIREQRALILSLYRQYVRTGGTLGIRDFLGEGNEPSGWVPLCRLDFFEFHRFVGLYQSLFGAQHVLVLPMELLARDPSAYIRRLARFCGLPEGEFRPDVDPSSNNAGWCGLTLSICRVVNQLLPPAALGPTQSAPRRILLDGCRRADRLLPGAVRTRADDELERHVRRRIRADHFARSNAALQTMTGLDLTRFDYPVSESHLGARRPTALSTGFRPPRPIVATRG